MAKNIPNLLKNINLHMQEAHQIPIGLTHRDPQLDAK